MRRRPAPAPVLVPLIILILPLLLGASTEEGGHASATMDFVGKVVNFLILFGGLTFLLRKPAKALLIKQTAAVGDSIREAESGRTAAESRAAASRAKADGLAGEVAALKAQAEAEGKRESERIARAARDEAERLKKLTRQELEAQVRQSVGELKAYAAARATALARERIRRRLTPERQAALIDRSIDRLSRIHEKPAPR
ncbi:MAG: ATP synthase F0 subunit B [Candidatus Aminicenantes bacterium]|jgi:F-type H+-transporting ATPase subunit b|nr:ATP synthase F0 subunit B [Candidatus Aminicenantes bacterium]NLH75532.1 ATP synthase F0 subunit B [Acidobacteriota bacterium]